jgi:hypothetical protein
LPVFRYRSIEEMPRRWRKPDDPDNLRLVAQMMRFYRTFSREVTKPGVRRYRSVEEAEADRTDGPTRR